MSTARKLIAIHPAQAAHMPGLSTWQALPAPGLSYLDPFILLNHHGPEDFPPQNEGLPFGPHPHRGFETLTFVFSGDIVHEDSTGERHVSGPGDVQWMTAGRGIVHSETSSERFKAEGGREEVLQLWMNLPARLKMTEPRYFGYRREELTLLEADQGRVQMRLIAGSYDQAEGPHQSLTELMMSYVELQAGADWSLSIPEGAQVFCYLLRGELDLEGQVVSDRHLVQWDLAGSHLRIKAQQESLMLFGYGLPLEEPVAAQGPFVMNYQGEIRQAFLDYQAGKFV